MDGRGGSVAVPVRCEARGCVRAGGVRRRCHGVVRQ
jgi:hypothetical protein